MSPLQFDDSTSAASGQAEAGPYTGGEDALQNEPTAYWDSRGGSFLEGNLPPYREKEEILQCAPREEARKVYVVQGAPATIAAHIQEWSIWNYEQSGRMPVYFGGLNATKVKYRVKPIRPTTGDGQDFAPITEIDATYRAEFSKDTMAITGIRVADIVSVTLDAPPDWYIARYRRQIDKDSYTYVGPGFATMDLLTRETDPSHPTTAIVIKCDKLDLDAYEPVAMLLLSELRLRGFPQVRGKVFDGEPNTKNRHQASLEQLSGIDRDKLRMCAKAWLESNQRGKPAHEVILKCIQDVGIHLNEQIGFPKGSPKSLRKQCEYLEIGLTYVTKKKRDSGTTLAQVARDLAIEERTLSRAKEFFLAMKSLCEKAVEPI